MPPEPIVTLIMTSEGRGPIRISPEQGGDWGRFPIQDPMGLRRAVNPVFVQTLDGMVPMGTGFHVDLTGAFVTAEHVVTDSRPKLGQFHQVANKMFPTGGTDPTAVVMLGGWTGFGTFKVPDWSLVRANEVWVQIKQQDDPLAQLQGRPDSIIAADFASLQLALSRPQPVATLPIRLTGQPPQVGESVVAIGFPDMTISAPVAPSSLPRLSVGMHGAYGTVTALHPEGRDRANPGPCIEVQADWPLGMSGGPVFNRAGEVIGLVSRGLDPTGDHPGVAWATCFALAPWTHRLMPSVHPERPLERVIVVSRSVPPEGNFSGPGL